MAVQIPERLRDLLSWEKRALGYLAVVLKDGTPHVTPVWFDYDGTDVTINTARGRVKDRALHRRRYAALTIQDPANPYRYLQIRGPVVEETEVDADHQIRKLNEKYHGQYEFTIPPGMVRVTYIIRPEHVTPSD